MSIERARDLRKRMTPAEARVWNLLRREPLKPYHFRRQVQIGPYYADFASHRVRLVIEIDGWTHSSDSELAYDRRRTSRLAGDGYRVVRFTNYDVMNQLDGVFETLMTMLPPPDPALPGHPRVKLRAGSPHEGEGEPGPRC